MSYHLPISVLKIIYETGLNRFQPVVNRSWSEPVRTGLVTAKKPEKTGLHRSGSVFWQFGIFKDRSWSQSKAFETGPDFQTLRTALRK